MRNFFALAIAAVCLAAADAAPLVLTSPTLAENGLVPREHVYSGCNGLNRSPALSWSGAPAGTKSFAVTVFDPDAPHPGGWWHWLVFDIPADAKGLAENASDALPRGAVQSRSDFGTAAYGGPCPPPGRPHRYVFTVYALKTANLAAAANDPPAKVDAAIRRNAIAQASLTARYAR